MFQSTFPRGERHTREEDDHEDTLVSIHVPARGTTVYKVDRDKITGVSIHVPARGTTLFPNLQYNITKVSIHVPARGTTLSPEKEGGYNNVSIHVPARGTTTNAFNASEAQKFQSTFPRGERPPQTRITAHPHMVSIHVPARGTTTEREDRRVRRTSFNPRCREGNDA